MSIRLACLFLLAIGLDAATLLSAGQAQKLTGFIGRGPGTRITFQQIMTTKPDSVPGWTVFGGVPFPGEITGIGLGMALDTVTIPIKQHHIWVDGVRRDDLKTQIAGQGCLYVYGTMTASDGLLWILTEK